METWVIRVVAGNAGWETGVCGQPLKHFVTTIVLVLMTVLVTPPDDIVTAYMLGVVYTVVCFSAGAVTEPAGADVTTALVAGVEVCAWADS